MQAQNGGNQEDWSVECSDDEYKEWKGPWEPPASDILELYTMLERDGVLELEWQSPGRRPPSPAGNEYQQDEESSPSKAEEKSDFDFMDEVASPKLMQRRGGDVTPKGSAKKKTTSLDGILSNMRRHRKMEEMEKQAGNS